MSNSGCTNTTGILLLGDTAAAMTGKINNSHISGAYYGIVIDDVVKSINLKGNTLWGIPGDPPLDPSIGVCSGINVGEIGKPNNISGFDIDDIDTPC